MSSNSSLEGALSKWTNVMKGWQFRWFVLDEKIGVLSYYTSKEKMSKGVRRGCVRLKGAVVGIDDQDMTTFTITVDHKTFHFQAHDSEERELWVRRLEDTIMRHASRLRGGQNWDVGSIYNNISCTKRGNILELFDKKVTEADAYLQLLIDQVNVIEQKMETLEKTEDKERCEEIKTQANAMLENVKHSIVLLQIAKNTVHPINGIYQGPSRRTETQPEFATVTQGVAFGAECTEGKAAEGSEVDASSTGDPSPEVPYTSYSSSEGEDDFEDANDEFFSAAQTATSPMGRQNIVGDLDEDDDDDPVLSIKSDHTQSEKKGGTLPMNRDGSLDYDAMYDADDDDDAMSMESHGSVVTHLLSQVKIGMDLTKVVLPTFILERRSLLEMYADYFAHPDIFVKIATLPTPRERMVQTVRWYLSSYHAGRKSAVAKKPYNPILGEIFQCHWDVPSEQGQQEPEPMDPVPDGPVPWCKSNQLTFVAEQVSHHPPISAFYAENVNKKISFNAYVWTKSKFLGISIGVHNIGQGVVTLNDLKEEYIVTFPNGYGRSILTVPWIELGGPVTISCPQTNYRAEIEFLTKPFYGGKRNRISAEIFAPNEKKSFMSVTGEWSGAMEYKINDGSNGGGSFKAKSGVFVNVNELPISTKKVRPIAEQEVFESRRIWKEVTAGLKLNDIERATSAKSAVEQKQREEAKARKEDNVPWKTRSFYAIGDAWNYQNPLARRLYEK